jgi:hypothetical protein
LLGGGLEFEDFAVGQLTDAFAEKADASGTAGVNEPIGAVLEAFLNDLLVRLAKVRRFFVAGCSPFA